MKEHPILFSGPMVRALLNGSKTQTRRVLKPIPDCYEGGYWDSQTVNWYHKGIYGKTGACMSAPYPRYLVGDQLWVRESWSTWPALDAMKPSEIGESEQIVFAATGKTKDGFVMPNKGTGRPSIFMCRWMSRLTLTVTDVRVQRLRDIRGTDAWAEGVPTQSPDVNPLHEFEELWDSINGKTYPWESNPWIVAYTFEKSDQELPQKKGHRSDPF